MGHMTIPKVLHLQTKITLCSLYGFWEGLNFKFWTNWICTFYFWILGVKSDALELDAILNLCSTLLSVRQAAFPHTIDTSSSWITDSGVWKCIRTAQASNTLNRIDIGKFSSSSHHSCLSALFRHWNQDEGFPRPCIQVVQKDKHLHRAVWITFPQHYPT